MTEVISASKKKELGATTKVFLDEVDARIARTTQELERTELWETLVSPNTDPRLLKAMMREVSLEIYSYQPQVTEAVFCTVGRLDKTNPRMLKSMLLHQADEADHGEMAFKDYLSLGGEEARGRSHQMSVPAFAFASLWWGVARMANPFAYLGMMYPFESITPYASQKAVEVLTKRGFDEKSLGFAVFHATEDIKHTNLLRHLMGECVEQYDDAADAITFGLELFLQHYPIPVWQAEFDRARSARE